MVGLGAQDSLGLARDFVSRAGTTFSMLWDSSGRSWRELGIRGQPAAILLSRQGAEVARWIGPFDDEEVLRRAASA
ncbi:MAG: TlpA family protein disulfide reductase [Acidimicrobiales bacterium]